MTDIITKSLAAEILASTNQPEIVTKTEEQKNVTETKTNDEHLCPICYATMDKIDIFALDCSHLFHVTCIDAYHLSKDQEKTITCPVCRFKYENPILRDFEVKSINRITDRLSATRPQTRLYLRTYERDPSYQVGECYSDPDMDPDIEVEDEDRQYDIYNNNTRNLHEIIVRRIADGKELTGDRINEFETNLINSHWTDSIIDELHNLTNNNLTNENLSHTNPHIQNMQQITRDMDIITRSFGSFRFGPNATQPNNIQRNSDISHISNFLRPNENETFSFTTDTNDSNQNNNGTFSYIENTIILNQSNNETDDIQ